MMIIDKAAWQIDGGIPENLVISHFNTVFGWLNAHGMLSEAGKEELERFYQKYAAIMHYDRR